MSKKINLIKLIENLDFSMQFKSPFGELVNNAKELYLEDMVKYFTTNDKTFVLNIYNDLIEEPEVDDLVRLLEKIDDIVYKQLYL